MTEQFQGFEEPKENWSKVPHILIEAFPLMKSQAEIKVIFYILRHTWGYHDTEKKITVDEFCNGRKHKDGTRIDGGTGLSKPSVIAGIKAAVEHGFIKVEIDNNDKARVKKYYSLMGKESLPQESRNFTPEVKKLSTDQRKKLKKETKEDSSPSGENPTFDPFSGVGEQTASEKTKSEYVKAMEYLEEVFANARGCKLPDWERDPKAANKRWRMPLAKKWREYDQNTGLVARGIREVVQQMKHDQLTFDAPDQIVKTLSSWLINQQSSNGNGHGLAAQVIFPPAVDTRKTLAELQAGV